MPDLLQIIIRSVCVYLFMIAGIRIFGKNQLSQLNAGDVVLLLLISNAVQNAMVGTDTSLQGGLAAAAVLFIINFGLKKLLFKHPKLKSLIESEAVILIKDGKVDEQALLHNGITLDELQETVREHGVEFIKDAKLAVLEVDGNISVVSFGDNTETYYSRHKRGPAKRHKI